MEKLLPETTARNFTELYWEGSFDEYLEIVREHIEITRNAFQRAYDMIMSKGLDEYIDSKKKIIKYNFFKNEEEGGKDAIYGLDIPLMRLVHVLEAASQGYGPERRIILLHGPVGSSKSTIVRLLKKGLEQYSRTPEGALYTFSWVIPPELQGKASIVSKEHGEIAGEDFPCPMNEEPLKIIPPAARAEFLRNLLGDGAERVKIEGDLCPACRFIFRNLMIHYSGEISRIKEHVKVKRFIMSEQDRLGIGTFQPKDEKNQDSTELTGDINYRKIAIYGTESDPRAFNFDGEFNVANRGIIEFIEILKLDVAFLYDLLGATQEHMIKPKKFAQTTIDEVIIAHSVAGEAPVMSRHEGKPGWSTLAGLYERFGRNTDGLEVLAHNFESNRASWTRVRSVLRHRFIGEWITTSQKWAVVETTPNHSIYDREGNVFFPEQQHEIMAIRELHNAFPCAGEGELIDVVEGAAGFVRHDTRRVAGGGPMTRPAAVGWARLDAPRHATQVRAVYHPVEDQEALKQL
ncbi:MAG: serine/threonine protein kinase, partial [Pseudomonadota bacterium]